MTTSRCPRCDRAECPWWTTTEIPTKGDVPAFMEARHDCERRAVSVEQWRSRALAAEAERDRLREAVGNIRTCLIAFDQHVAVTSGTVEATEMIAASTAFVRRVRSFLSKYDAALATAAGKEADR